ncbi:hypothetical protein, partial [Proteus mirabilis]|uniref:hypothetical protein n=1 Tax=Proteus mirabilis TaxID=584 RepID=UPI001953EB17
AQLELVAIRPGSRKAQCNAKAQTLPNQQNRHTHIDSIIYRSLLLPFHTTQITPKKSGANNILEINSSS